jgi:ribosomal protein L7/L12
MKVTDPRTLDPAIVTEVRAAMQPGYNVDEVVALMRSRGFSKIDSIKFLRDFAGIPLHDGKEIVHLSPAWSDRYASDEAFHDAAERAAEIAFSEETSAA